jgi:hypothetical protein
VVPPEPAVTGLVLNREKTNIIMTRDRHIHFMIRWFHPESKGFTRNLF